MVRETLVDRADADLAEKARIVKRRFGYYAVIPEPSRGEYCHRYLHRDIAKRELKKRGVTLGGKVVSHINKNSLDNRKCNLKVAGYGPLVIPEKTRWELLDV